MEIKTSITGFPRIGEQRELKKTCLSLKKLHTNSKSDIGIIKESQGLI
jgi:hypothetical protein